ncbi:unnamed protein product [Rangifer tarandus platyrhynchus]|uniref:Uncharacterized protein n=2 Tax=Rangifer tarandus platyrhynchus TaxID=3082113 RepID=A0ACB0FMT4_RANTA|nr:unnamed protein product [Rangifer tarandus platyrhynchus]CAI9714285.1 unnamed protein product [Rangifer tarandus platyrhynchus]
MAGLVPHSILKDETAEAASRTGREPQRGGGGGDGAGTQLGAAFGKRGTQKAETHEHLWTNSRCEPGPAPCGASNWQMRGRRTPGSVIPWLARVRRLWPRLSWENRRAGIQHSFQSSPAANLPSLPVSAEVTVPTGSQPAAEDLQLLTAWPGPCHSPPAVEASARTSECRASSAARGTHPGGEAHRFHISLCRASKPRGGRISALTPLGRGTPARDGSPFVW